MAIQSDTFPTGPMPARPGRPADPDSLRRIATAAGCVGLVVLNLLVVTGVGGPLRAVVGFPVAVLLPGAFALRATGLDAVVGWAWLLRAVALSIAALMAVSLGLGLLPGAALSTAGSLIGLDLLVAVLAAAVAVRNHRSAAAPLWTSTVDGAASGRRTAARGPAWFGHQPARVAVPAAVRMLVPDRGSAWVAAAAIVPGAAAVGLAVAGASRLDAGGSSTMTVAALVCAAVAVVPAALAARRRDDSRIAGAGLYLLGLAVLLATSLRGNGVTGHDVKIEYRVFVDTYAAGSWGPGGANVSYDSCLSITVLPTFFARLLGLAPLDVFAICFPLLFALVPVAVFLIARHLLPPVQALVAGVLFVAFPTFVNDMTMLNRQQIATVFFAAAVLTLLDERPSRRRSWLLAVLAVGLTVSHYTTTYVAAAVLLLAWAMLAAPRLLRRRPAVVRTGLGAAGALLVVLAVGWALLTGIDSVVGSTVRQAATAVGERADVSSEATSYSLIGGSRRQTDQEVLDRYVARLRASRANAGVAPADPDCVIRLVPADVLPATRAGAALADVGIDPGAANSVLREAAVVLYELGAIVGLLLLWLGWSRRRRRGQPVGPDRLVLAGLTAGCLVLLVGTVLAPQLSDDYGPLRLFQQALVVLAAGVVLTVATALSRLRAVTADRVMIGIAVGCLLTTSGVVPQLTGDYAPQLNLNNAGSYFRAYYAQRSDLATSGWIDGNVDGGSVVVADTRDGTNLRALTRVRPQVGLAPGTVPAADRVLLTSADARSAVATAVVGDRVLRYQFPLDCVAAGRPLLHADGVHRLYGPAG